MVFESVPVYLDPLNWQQQLNQQQQNITADNSIRQLPSCPTPASQQQHQFNASGGSLGGHMGNGSGGNMLGSIRPGSMVDRARLAKLPLPEAGLKCPRCESTNTKFCYFNNYSLSQPRHFCKACRRYWTRGGALRSVPVGGGCRRNNKRSGKSSRRSGSPVSTMERRGGGGGGGIGSRSGGLSSSTTHDHPHRLNTVTSGTSHLAFHPPQLTYLPSFQNLGGQDYLPRDIGSLNLGVIPPPPSMADMGGGGGDGGMNFNETSSLTQAHRFPFLSDLETHPTNGMYSSFDQSTEGNLEPSVVADGSCGGGLIRSIYQANNKGFGSGCIINSQITPPSSSSVKMEDVVKHQGLINSSKSNILLGLDNQGMNNNSSNHEDDQQQYNWNGSCTAGTWTDLSSFTQSSSTSHHLL